MGNFIQANYASSLLAEMNNREQSTIDWDRLRERMSNLPEVRLFEKVTQCVVSDEWLTDVYQLYETTALNNERQYYQIKNNKSSFYERKSIWGTLALIAILIGSLLLVFFRHWICILIGVLLVLIGIILGFSVIVGSGLTDSRRIKKMDAFDASLSDLGESLCEASIMYLAKRFNQMPIVIAHDIDDVLDGHPELPDGWWFQQDIVMLVADELEDMYSQEEEG